MYFTLANFRFCVRVLWLSPNPKPFFASSDSNHFHLHGHFCQFSWVIPGDLKLHERSHIVEEPFSCSQCDKKFVLCGDLKQHERIHTGEKHFTCWQCDKKFKGKFDCSLECTMSYHHPSQPLLTILYTIDSLYHVILYIQNFFSASTQPKLTFWPFGLN